MKNMLYVLIAGTALASLAAAAPEASKPAGNPNHAAPWSKELDAFDAGYRDGKPIWADPELDTIARNLGVRMAEELLAAGAEELAPLGTPVSVDVPAVGEGA